MMQIDPAEASKPPKFDIFPFVAVALIWATGGAGVLATSIVDNINPGKWAWGFFALWGLSLLDLYLIGKVVASLLSLVAENQTINRSVLVMRTVLWGFAKLNVLALFGWFFIEADSLPGSALISGASTLIVVPIGGGLWWTRRTARGRRQA